MPFTKNAAGKWIESADSGPSDQTCRLMIIDKQVDADGSFQRSLLKDVKAITFDSKVTIQAELFGSIRQAHCAHRAHGKPFVSIVFANHGPADTVTPWTIASDLAMPLASVAEATLDLAPFVELLTSLLEPTAIGQSHIIFLACALAGFNPELIPALEELYHVDFMASTDKTGGAAAGANWKMETDGEFDVGKAYCEPKKLAAYRATMHRGKPGMGHGSGNTVASGNTVNGGVHLHFSPRLW
jgi:hypothetical protein